MQLISQLVEFLVRIASISSGLETALKHRRKALGARIVAEKNERANVHIYDATHKTFRKGRSVGAIAGESNSDPGYVRDTVVHFRPRGQIFV